MGCPAAWRPAAARITFAIAFSTVSVGFLPGWFCRTCRIPVRCLSLTRSGAAWATLARFGGRPAGRDGWRRRLPRRVAGGAVVVDSGWSPPAVGLVGVAGPVGVGVVCGWVAW